MFRLVIVAAVALAPASAAAQPAPPAVALTSADVKAFIDKLPKDRVSDLPIRVADVGGYKVGVYGVFRPRAVAGDAILHDTSVTEIYYMLEGSGTLTTGGTLVDERSDGVSPNTARPNRRGSRMRAASAVGSRRATSSSSPARCRTGGAASTETFGT